MSKYYQDWAIVFAAVCGIFAMGFILGYDSGERRASQDAELEVVCLVEHEEHCRLYRVVDRPEWGVEERL